MQYEAGVMGELRALPRTHVHGCRWLPERRMQLQNLVSHQKRPGWVAGEKASLMTAYPPRGGLGWTSWQHRAF